jgi:hypothetical protein
MSASQSNLQPSQRTGNGLVPDNQFAAFAAGQSGFWQYKTSLPMIL